MTCLLKSHLKAFRESPWCCSGYNLNHGRGGGWGEVVGGRDGRELLRGTV